MNTGQQNPRAKSWLGLAIITLLFFLAGCTSPKPDLEVQQQLNYPLMSQAWDIIQKEYVAPSAVNSETATYGAINGMMDSLGDTGHSTFLTPQAVRNFSDAEHGRLKGIGVEIRMKGRRTVVVAPIDNSPAQRAGLRSGDIILKVDGQDISDWTLTRVVDHITGPQGTSVSLTILQPDSGHTHQVTITRAALKLHPITWQMLPGTDILHLRIASFEGGTTRELRRVLNDLEHRGNVKGIILDLRNNPGGMLNEAIGVTSQFLGSGNVLLIKDAKGHLSPVPVKKGGIALKTPMAVLINSGTASAAEIVAGAVQDAGRAPLIGEQTFGTGTVLETFPLKDGSALLLAVEEWLTPNGRSFWHKGLEPQFPVTLPDEAAVSIPSTERTMTPDQLHKTDDTQLLRALQWFNEKKEPSAEQKQI